MKKAISSGKFVAKFYEYRTKEIYFFKHNSKKLQKLRTKKKVRRLKIKKKMIRRRKVLTMRMKMKTMRKR
jgi:hypothetical protein